MYSNADKLDKLCCFTNIISQVVLLRLKCSSISFFFFFFFPPEVHCGGTLRADSGEIQTPNFPFHYPRSTDCQWKIVVSGSSITLNFEEFEVQWDVQMMLRRSALQIVCSAWKQQSLHHVTHQILPLLITLKLSLVNETKSKQPKAVLNFKCSSPFFFFYSCCKTVSNFYFPAEFLAQKPEGVWGTVRRSNDAAALRFTNCL